MNKTIKKTIIYTLLTVLAIILITLSVLTVFVPSVIGNMCFDTGAKRLCVWYTEQEYENGHKIEKLDKLLYRVKWLDDDKLVVKYSEAFISNTNFDVFCKKQDEKDAGKSYGCYEYYIYGDYIVALYETGDKDKAILQSIDYVSNKGKYDLYNPCQTLLYKVAEKRDKETLGELLEKIGIFVDTAETQDKTIAKSDYENFTKIYDKL